ncbi:hypothetical protein DUNSADRAFT_4407 [Dunaliella salina]|uniref:HNH domain-containing protein n=1 Tax=Dunaliella salina TaxID=3046 RepID=A0ABQ7GS37_DUNSA|nr:hypothetical protein DUNSADRAFT_4407 [Dunaliella salina]|eukprot:KAF5837427.1 hypothetical protein DUNSADRAFT_4407 [Dunaliella salina]
MPPKQQACAFGTCSFPCIASNHKTNFFRKYPNGYPGNDGFYTCRNCPARCTGKEIQVDHIKPKTPKRGQFDHGGTNCVKNLQPLCPTCNNKKKNNFPSDDRMVRKIPNKFRRPLHRLMDGLSI